MGNNRQRKNQYRGVWERIVYIDQAIRRVPVDDDIPEHVRANANTICNYLKQRHGIEVTPRTIKRDIEFMRFNLDCPIEYDQRRFTYYYSDPNFLMPSVMMHEGELFAMFLADKLLEQYSQTPIYENLKTVFQKIKSSLKDETKVALVAQKKFTVLPPFSTTIVPAIWDTVIRGLKDSRTIQMVYRVPGRSPTIRRLDPYHAVKYEGDWYIVGNCHLRNEIRTFSLSRIQQAELLHESFEIPPDFDFRQFTGSRFGVHWGKGEYRVKVLFLSSVADYIRERQWHPTQEIKEIENGDIEFTMTVNHLLEVKRWILSWGENVKVLEPKELRKEIVFALTNALHAYSDYT